MRGQIKTGGEVSHTDNNNHYDLLDGATLSNALSSTANEAKQNLYAGFAEYSRPWREIKGCSGYSIRIYKIRLLYQWHAIRRSQQNLQRFYPSASVSYNSGDIQMSLVYRYSTQRPSYFSLRSAVAMNSPYSYEGGNPQLQRRRPI